MSKERIAWIDMSKGIGIILVMIGHMETTEALRTYIFSFHMPLFFFISGYVFSVKDSFIEFVWKKFKSLILPYLYFSVIDMLILMICKEKSFTLLNGIEKTLLGYGIDAALWFLVCAFFTEVGFYVLTKVLKDNILKLMLFALVCSVIGYFLSIYRVELFWKINAVMFSVLFFSFGQFIKKYDIINRIMRTNKVIQIEVFSASAVVSIVFCFANYMVFFKHVDMKNNFVGNYLFFYLSAIGGIISIVLFANFIKWSRILDYFGRNTLIIMLAYEMIIYSLIVVFRDVLGISVDLAVIKLVYRITSIPLLILVIFAINNFFPFLISKKNDGKDKAEVAS